MDVCKLTELNTSAHLTLETGAMPKRTAIIEAQDLAEQQKEVSDINQAN